MGSCALSRLRIVAPLLIILLATLFAGRYIIAQASIDPNLNFPKHNGIFKYEFRVSVEGSAHVKITYKSGFGRGSSWVFVPRFISWVNRTLHGRLIEWIIDEPEKYTGSQYYFYKVLAFSFISDSAGFELIIEYDFPLAAIVIESESTRGVFYSPQIGFEEDSLFEAIIVFPKEFKARVNEAVALGKYGYYGADRNSNSSYIIFKNIPSGDNLLRLQVTFDSMRSVTDIITLRSGIFEFTTVARYEGYAKKIIDLYDKTYDMLTSIFNVTLDHVKAKFFIPDPHTLMSLGGYIPFSGGTLGDIYINFMFTRYVEGYLEVVALHELVHHFMWRAGVSPERFLWFHEGMAQFISIEIAERMGYEGARMVKEEINGVIRKLNLSEKSNLKFLKDWTPYNTPGEISVLYASAYYIISELAEEYGGLEYYARFFRLIKGVNIESNAILCYYLSLAANRSIFDKFNLWGFDLPEIYNYWPLIAEVKRAIGSISPVNPFLQPFKRIAELLYLAAVSGEISQDSVQLLLSAALFIARNVSLIALTIYSCILLLTILLLARGARRRTNASVIRGLGHFTTSISTAIPCFIKTLAFSSGRTAISSGLKGPYTFMSTPIIWGISLRMRTTEKPLNLGCSTLGFCP